MLIQKKCTWRCCLQNVGQFVKTWSEVSLCMRQQMREGVTVYRRLSLAGRIHRMLPGGLNVWKYTTACR